MQANKALLLCHVPRSYANQIQVTNTTTQRLCQLVDESCYQTTNAALTFFFDSVILHGYPAPGEAL